MREQLFCLAALLTAFPMMGFSSLVVIESASGQSIPIEIAEESFADALEIIRESLTAVGGYEASAGAGIELNFSSSSSTIFARSAKKSSKRNYYASVTSEEKSDIHHIIKTLANESLIKIKKMESSLVKAGDRINHIHPLKFLGYIFSEEELIICMHNLQGRRFVWKRFLNDTIEAIEEEADRGNILSFAAEFAEKINLDPDLIIPSMKEEHWAKFIDILIDKVPRKGQPDRYKL